MLEGVAPNAESDDAHDILTRIVPLSALDDYEIADGYPEVRGWDVIDADGRSIGCVYDLLVDVEALRVRYLDVELRAKFATHEADRRVLIPMESIDLDGTGDQVVLPDVRVADVRELVPFARRGVSAASSTLTADAVTARS